MSLAVTLRVETLVLPKTLTLRFMILAVTLSVKTLVLPLRHCTRYNLNALKGQSQNLGLEIYVLGLSRQVLDLALEGQVLVLGLKS